MFKGRLAGIKFGPYLLRAPIANFSRNEEHGLLASSDFGALVGGEILKRFLITFDFPHARILIEPNAHFSEPFHTNESGLRLLARGKKYDQFLVDSVEPGSAAEAAGVHKGDLVIKIDGHRASELDLVKIDDLLQAGRSVRVIFRRGVKTFHTVVKITERI
jgi:hypothetical protein